MLRLLALSAPVLAVTAFLFASLPARASPSPACGDAHAPPGLEAPSALDANNFRIAGRPILTLTWQDNSTDEECFVIERRVATPPAPGNTPPWETIAVVDADTTACIDWGPYGMGEGGLFYRVYAATSNSRSEYSNEDFDGIPPPPTPFMVTPPPWKTGVTCESSRWPTGDVNCSGTVDSLDALYILQHVAHVNYSEIAIGCPPIGETAGGISAAHAAIAASAVMGGLFAASIISRRKRRDGQAAE